MPGIFVDHIVVEPNQMQTTQTQFDPAISGEVCEPLSTFEPVARGADKIIARRAALETRAGEAVTLRFGISALVPRILLEEGPTEAVIWAIEQGAVGGVPLLGFAFGCAANARVIVPSPRQFTYLQGGGFDRAFLSFMQIDADSSVNVSKLAAKPHVTAGLGGFIDITAKAWNNVFAGYMTAGGRELKIEYGRPTIVKEGRNREFVPELEQVTLSGRMARERGQNVVYVACTASEPRSSMVETDASWNAPNVAPISTSNGRRQMGCH